MADFTIKRYDLLPVIEADLSYSDGTQPDLTGATVDFIMRTTGGALPTKVNAAAEIVNATAPAKVRYSWLAGDTDTIGQFEAEWEVHFTGPPAKTQTFPTDSWHTIEVVRDLDEAT